MNNLILKAHKGNLPSPVAGMSMGDWLGLARITENQLETLMARTDLDPLQLSKLEGLLAKVRADITTQLSRINLEPLPRP
jgi:hypothetical protein